eukprot:CAMPEP_0194500044 /NCGR_PEP_ID=MMETSP0253-20130528/16146_1 /TAXON_ID=2966 /ORGANISM="Noctiluca scintillans" /LENGTH=469 /DNA_ID=CAMNT_0039341855 /DNA_START=77 /DNA_END=1483 /DNA_ORIENTATION=+
MGFSVRDFEDSVLSGDAQDDLRNAFHMPQLGRQFELLSAVRGDPCGENASSDDALDASFLDFAQLANTGPGEFVFKEASVLNGELLDLILQTVGENGSVIANHEVLDVEPVGGFMFRVQFAPNAEATFKLFFVRSDTRTTVTLNPAIFTIMDIDCGSLAAQDEICESVTVSSEGLLQHIAGDLVLVTEGPNNDNFTFHDNHTSGGENNPTSIRLTDEQKKLSVTLAFQDREHIELHLVNAADYMRNLFFAGVTNACRPDIGTPSTSPPGAEGDPHVTSVTGERFDLWKTGWSSFLQIPRSSSDVVKLQVLGNVQPYFSAQCAPAYLHEVIINGSWLGERTISIRAGSLESNTPLAVSINDQVPMMIDNADGTEFLSDGDLQVLGRIGTSEPEKWGPDANVHVEIGAVRIEIAQHTEGRGEDSQSMLDMTLAGLDNVPDTMGGWLGFDGSSHAGEAPKECRAQLLQTQGS